MPVALPKGAKPTAKLATKKPLPKLAGKGNGKLPTKAAAEKTAKPPKETKAFVDADIVIFKGYVQEIDKESGKPIVRENTLFTEGEELAIVGTRQDETSGATWIACVPVSGYYKYKEDSDSVAGEEISPTEVKRTNRKVEALYHLPMVGDMAKLLKDSDPLEKAVFLYEKANENFFYMGGLLAKLWKEKDEESGKSLFTTYEDGDGNNFEDSKEGFEAFIVVNFGEGFGGQRKALEYMSIYEHFSGLNPANSVKSIQEFAAIKWSKAALLAQYVTDENVGELLEKAKEQSYKELKETLKTEYTTEGRKPGGNLASKAIIRRTTIHVRLYEDRAAAFEMIIKAAKKQTGIQNDDDMIEHIVQEWASEHITEAAEKATAAGKAKLKALLKQNAKLPADHPAAVQEEATA